MRIDVAAQSDIGRRKKNNEDSYGIFRDNLPNLKLFREGAMVCVADGLGGHAGGVIASKLAVMSMKDVLGMDPAPEAEDPTEDGGPLPIIKQGILSANNRVHQTNIDLVKEGKPMGTTLLTAVISPKRVYICNVGDSRAYHIRDGDIIARTEDHSWVDEQVKAGLMSKAEAERDHRKNYVTRSVGTQPEVSVDSYTWSIVPGDWLLFCTDGLVNMVPDNDMILEFRRPATAAEIAQRLVNLANENGGKDNVTIVAANVHPHPLRMLTVRLRSLFRRKGSLVGLGIICFALGVLAGFLTCYLLYQQGILT